MTTVAPERVRVGREDAARTLEAAALELEVNGWTQGTWERADGALCMVGAVGRVLSRDRGDSFRHAKKLLVGDAFSHIPVTFNDTLAADGAEVCFVLRWRAAELRAGR